MSDNTRIEWADASWSPLLGCSRVSAGCDHCYAITGARIRESNPNPKVAGPYSGLVEERGGRIDWTGRVNLLPERLDQPIRWKRPRRIFVNSQSDLFHDDVPDDFIARVFGVMAATPRHEYQVLTKRPGRMRSLLNSGEFARRCSAFGGALGDLPWPLPNIWLGTSIEDQRWANVRVPLLLDTPAAVRFLSAEPLLGAVRIGRNSIKGIGWVIAGGESGAGARPAHPDWFRSLRDECQAAGVPFFFKQYGVWAPVDVRSWRDRRDSDRYVRQDGYSWPLVEPHGADDGTEALVRRIGKGAAGRILDGREWSDFPA